MFPNVYPGMPVHPDMIAEYNRRMEAEAETMRRQKLIDKNRKAGKPAPTDGTKLFVSTARGIPRRSRAGVLFNYIQRTEVLVRNVSDEELAEIRAKGSPTPVVTVDGAEQILDDDALVVYQSAADGDLARAAEAIRQRDERIAELEAQLRASQVQARRDAVDPGTGAPSRLPAARKAAEDFGGEPGGDAGKASSDTSATGGHAKGHGGAADSDTKPGKSK